MVFFIKHINIEGPETLGEFFKKHGFTSRTLDLSYGDNFPKDFSDIEAVVCLGGPMNVYEEDKYPFLKEEDVFIKKVLKEEISFLGICLGSQLLAKAAGAKVTENAVKEIGWYKVELTADGKKDLLFEGIPEEIEIYQWHGDTFAIPREGKWLASSQLCAHQALKVGPCAYGLQFHIEITDKSIQEWSDEYFKDDMATLTTQKGNMLKRYEENKKSFHFLADKIFSNFLKIIPVKKAVR